MRANKGRGWGLGQTELAECAEVGIKLWYESQLHALVSPYLSRTRTWTAECRRSKAVMKRSGSADKSLVRLRSRCVLPPSLGLQKGRLGQAGLRRGKRQPNLSDAECRNWRLETTETTSATTTGSLRRQQWKQPRRHQSNRSSSSVGFA